MAGISLGHNIVSSKLADNLGDAANSYARSAQRLSSGLRINSAADDAAGLALATKLDSNSRVYTKAIQNVNDGISYLNVAQGALAELNSITTRQQELAQQAATGTLTSTQRNALNDETNALSDEWNRVVQTTQFNGSTILSSIGTLSVQAGYGKNGTIAITTASGLSHNVASGSVASQQNITTASDNYDISSVDVNGDGVLDLVTGGITSNKVWVSLGNSNGTFAAAASFGNSLNQPYAVAVGDFDGDGHQDIVVSNYLGGGGAVLLMRGNGNGTFSSAVTFANMQNPGEIKAADVNGDGKLDLIITADGTNKVNVFLGNGNGTFKAATSYATATANQTNTIAFADANGDGVNDMIIGGSAGYAVFLSNGNGTFKSAITGATAHGIADIDTGDFNGDGILDLVIGGYNTTQGLVMLGNGDGTYKFSATLATAGNSNSVLATDFNGDGFNDVLLTDEVNGVLRYYAGKGDGTFAAAVTLGTGANANRIVVNDFNGDGANDVAIAGGVGLEIFTSAVTASNLAVRVDLSSQTSALAAVTTLAAQSTRVSSEIGKLAASTSRLNFTLSYVSDLNDNYSQAASRITDIDVASEASNLLRAQILQDTDTALLAQANLAPKIALGLIKD